MMFSIRAIPVVAGLLVAGIAVAEVPKPPDPGRSKNFVYSMRSGSIRVKDDPMVNREHLKKVAQWLAFTICQPPYNGEVPTEKLPPGIDRTMDGLIRGEMTTFVDLPIGGGTNGKPSQEQLEYSDEFGKAIADAVKVVLDNSGKPIERINAVRLMSIAAKIPAPSLADPFLTIIKNENISEAEKLYAFQGLKNLLEQSDVNDVTRPIFPGSAGTAKLGEIGIALNDYVMKKRTPKDEKERQVIEFIRRDAVAALARFKDAVLRKPNRDVIFRPGWALARVMEMDPTVTPPFTAAERAEASIGFCQMKVDAEENLDLAAYTMAKMLVIYAREANLDSERASATQSLPLLQWKILSARWSYNLAVWREQMKTIPKGRNAELCGQIANLGIILLAQIEKNGASAATGAEVQTITNWAKDNPPKQWALSQPANLFKDDAASILPFPAAPAPAPPVLKTPDPKATPPVDPKKGTTPKT
ncbi:MAG TPA: hypothetical protein VHR66_09695 [Gemmataceae bacterium]|jgi:hypothetical protein|nr:hypothetical protein [Gemmataceae bacterium]